MNKKTALNTINHLKTGWKEGWLDKPNTLNKQIAQAIFIDMSDRRGLKSELAMIDKEAINDMLEVWSIIIEKINNNKYKKSYQRNKRKS